jgi:hypothetical protein
MKYPNDLSKVINMAERALTAQKKTMNGTNRKRSPGKRLDTAHRPLRHGAVGARHRFYLVWASNQDLQNLLHGTAYVWAASDDAVSVGMILKQVYIPAQTGVSIMEYSQRPPGRVVIAR